MFPQGVAQRDGVLRHHVAAELLSQVAYPMHVELRLKEKVPLDVQFHAEGTVQLEMIGTRKGRTLAGTWRRFTEALLYGPQSDVKRFSVFLQCRWTVSKGSQRGGQMKHRLPRGFALSATSVPSLFGVAHRRLPPRWKLTENEHDAGPREGCIPSLFDVGKRNALRLDLKVSGDHGLKDTVDGGQQAR